VVFQAALVFADLDYSGSGFAAVVMYIGSLEIGCKEVAIAAT
jgi:hypothetical protein